MGSTIRETCSCGATFEATTSMLTIAGDAAAHWRAGHKHAESIGICGHELTVPGFDAPGIWCALKAGHTGMHSDGSSHWGQRVGEEAGDRG